jgi:sensor histidine kinase YesM
MFSERFTKYKLDHIFFWVLYALFWLIVTGSIANLSQTLNTFIVVFFHALVSYFNIYLLVPLLLEKQKYFSYVLSVILSITLICFPLAIIIYFFNPENGGSVWSIDFFLVNSFQTSYAVGLTLILHLSLQWYQREKEKSELLRLNSETELKYLKSQINPHFLFNSLNSIYALTLKKSDTAPQTVLKLSEMLRYLLYEAGEKKVTIDKEIAYINNYLELERLRLGNRGHITFEAETDSDEYLIEPMLLMPFLENSFKHGLNKVANNGWIEISLKINNGLMHFVISNNIKKQVIENKEDTVGGIGIENVKKRLNLLYPTKHKLLIESENNIYKVDLTLNIF